MQSAYAGFGKSRFLGLECPLPKPLQLSARFDSEHLTDPLAPSHPFLLGTSLLPSSDSFILHNVRFSVQRLWKHPTHHFNKRKAMRGLGRVQTVWLWRQAGGYSCSGFGWRGVWVEMSCCKDREKKLDLASKNSPSVFSTCAMAAGSGLAVLGTVNACGKRRLLPPRPHPLG